MLQQLASAGNGAYIRANNQRVGLSNLFDELNKIEKGEVVEKYLPNMKNSLFLSQHLALYY